VDSSTLQEAALDPWEKQPFESAKAFGAFKTYRDLPANERSLVKAVKHLYGGVRASKLRQFQTWSAQYGWVQRSTAWDIEVDRKAREDLIKRVKDMNDRHVKVAQAVQQKAIERLRNMQAIELSVGDTLNFILQSARMERLALGEPEEIHQHQTDVNLIDYSRLSPEELRKLLSARMASVPETRTLAQGEEEEEEEESAI
jgi:uncharacterized protein YoaH (UPF0181 family)